MEELLELTSKRVLGPQKGEITLGPDAEPMDLFYLVMRNNALPLSTRMRAAERIADFKYPKKQAIAVMPASGDLGTVLEAARRRAPMTLEDLTPEECEAVLSARAKAAPPREVSVPKPAPRRGLPKP
jgi:hypothetical protein